MNERAERILDKIINGNLTDAMDILFELEGPDLARCSAYVIDQIVLHKIVSTQVAVTQFIRLIDAWERSQ